MTPRQESHIYWRLAMPLPRGALVLALKACYKN